MSLVRDLGLGVIIILIFVSVLGIITVTMTVTQNFGNQIRGYHQACIDKGYLLEGNLNKICYKEINGIRVFTPTFSTLDIRRKTFKRYI